MTTYQLTWSPDLVVRLDDQVGIPSCDGNADWVGYQAWLAEGNTPLAADPGPYRAEAFAAQEDAERLALVAERAQADPAFAALAELALRGVSR